MHESSTDLLTHKESDRQSFQMANSEGCGSTLSLAIPVLGCAEKQREHEFEVRLCFSKILSQNQSKNKSTYSHERSFAFSVCVSFRYEMKELSVLRSKGDFIFQLSF